MQLEKLQKDMMEAMKAHDKARKESISVLYSAAKKVGIDSGCRENIPEEMVDGAILKELKSVKEQIETCPDNRPELLEEYKTRLAVFEEYAPKLLSANEVEEIIRKDYAEVLETKNKGMIMKNIMPALKGKADGKVINEVVAKICS
ncbi:MAG: GatB/YqeY domain-containing protein [Lachnospiraceae bacterium]|nr:GatB/YqeY domain-containing protein [Lachnospiraceae bacterium]